MMTRSLEMLANGREESNKGFADMMVRMKAFENCAVTVNQCLDATSKVE
jgi:hypothetical protein